MIAPDTTKTADDTAKYTHGVVERVVFSNEENGYSIFRVKTEHGRLESWVGPAPIINAGQPVRARGNVERDPKWGPQRRCDAILPVQPTDALGIEAYLAGGVIHGIGAALAKRIVAKFGAATLDIIASSPRDLLQVSGLGEAKLEAIIKAWPEVQMDAEVMAFLASIGAPPGISGKIVRRYRGETMAVLTRQPYRLALEVSGVGFKTADHIARAVGIPLDSPARAQAGVLHVLHEQTMRGDCYAPREMLADKTIGLLGPGCADPYDAVHALAITPVHRDHGPPMPRIVCERIGDDDIVYPRGLWEAEVMLADRLRSMLEDDGEPLPGAEEAISEFEKESGMTLGADQRQAVRDAARRRVIVITGGPGTGKSLCTKAVLSVFEKAKLKTMLMSPTGRAAKRLSEATGRPASTIHRALGIAVTKDDRKSAVGGFMHHAHNPLPINGIILDETSMCSLELANAVVQALPPQARLVLVGDFDQLPSVGPGAVLRDIIMSDAVPTTRLQRIFRQGEGSAIIAAAAAINSGHIPTGPSLDDNVALAEFYVERETDSTVAAQRVVQHVAGTLPTRFGFDAMRDITVLTPMHKGPCGTIELNKLLQGALNPIGTDGSGTSYAKGSVVFRVGDPVMQLKNNYDLDVFNGERGRVLAIDVENKRIVVDMDGRELQYGKPDIDDLALAYASSVHKSQGSTLRAVVMVIMPEHFMLLSRPICYTAATRAERLCVVVADPRSLGMAVRETRREVRRTRLVERLRGEA